MNTNELLFLSETDLMLWNEKLRLQMKKHRIAADDSEMDLFYAAALRFMETAESEQELQMAAGLFGMIRDWKDARQLQKQCLEKSLLPMIKDEALADQNSRTVLKTVPDAEGTGVKKEWSETERLIGRLKRPRTYEVQFGRYPQEKDGTEKPIDWLVLERTENAVLLISKYGLDARSYHAKSENVTWADCSLRSWLNDSFAKIAFTAGEREIINLSVIKNDSNNDHKISGGPDTEDQIFLLSAGEAKKYFKTNFVRTCRGTEYCKDKGGRVSAKGLSWWWLRSPGWASPAAAYVSSEGGIYTRGLRVDSKTVVVRPALWINL